MKVLYVNPQAKNCGMHQFGRRVFGALQAEASWAELHYHENFNDTLRYYRELARVGPDVVVASYANPTMPLMEMINRGSPHPPTVVVCHEPEPCMFDMKRAGTLPYHWLSSGMFDVWVAHDPTLIIPPDITNVLTTVRPCIRYSPPGPPPERFTVGSSTFAFPHKGHVAMTRRINEELDDCVVRFNCPPSQYGDPAGSRAKEVIQQCRDAATKPGISIQATYDMLDTEDELAGFLQQNTINIYYYEQHPAPHSMRGVASSPDTAVSVRRPVAVWGGTSMFRHLYPYYGEWGGAVGLKELCRLQLERNIPETVYGLWSPLVVAETYRKACFMALEKRRG